MRASRVATFVAQEPSPEEVFAVVTRETGMLLGAQRVTLLRVVDPGWAEVVAGWSDGSAPPVPVGHRGRLDTAIEAAAYFLVSEALTNVAKRAQATSVTVGSVSRRRRSDLPGARRRPRRCTCPPGAA